MTLYCSPQKKKEKGKSALEIPYHIENIHGIKMLTIKRVPFLGYLFTSKIRDL